MTCIVMHALIRHYHAFSLLRRAIRPSLPSIICSFIMHPIPSAGSSKASSQLHSDCLAPSGSSLISIPLLLFLFIAIPPSGVDYVHEHTNGSEFISSFIETIGKHGCTIDELLQQFHRYSDHVHVERTTHGEFDYLVYFEDGVPDDYRYCITDEGCHLIYHRFTPEDYEDFQF